jgi:PAS domain S-box-containing protein
MHTELHLLGRLAPAQGIEDAAQRWRLMVDAVDEYAIFLLAPDGTVMSWNPGAQRLEGYTASEILGRHFSVFYPQQDVVAGKPERGLEQAARLGSLTDDGWRVREDGTRFWAHVVITPLRDGQTLRGFANVTRDDTRARAAEERNRALHSITQALLAGDNPSEVLQKVTESAGRLTGAACTWLATLDQQGLVVRASDGTVDGPPVGAAVPDASLLADVFRAAAPTAVDDLVACCPDFPGLQELGAGLAVPLGAGRDVEGVLVAAAVRGATPFRPDDLQLLQVFADQIELVLGFHRAQQRLRDAQVSQDRERIARDLHDHVIQQLFAAGMILEGTAQRSTDPVVTRRVVETVDILDATIRRIRTTVFRLQDSTTHPTASIRADLLTVIAEAARGLGFEPDVELEGPIDTLVTPAMGEHLLAAVREMLSNVARHAAASTVTVTVCANDTVRVQVHDNGKGPPADIHAGSGLHNLTARASQLGGTFTFTAAVERGALATWTIPARTPAQNVNDGAELPRRGHRVGRRVRLVDELAAVPEQPPQSGCVGCQDGACEDPRARLD